MELQRILSLVTTVAETLLFAGVLYGWASLNPVLVKEGYFSGDCPSSNLTGNDTGETDDATCPSQSESLALVFSIASSIPPILTSVAGFLLDRFGAWFSRSIFMTALLLGYLLTAISTPATSWLLFLSMTLLAVGGYSTLLINLQSGNLFPKARASVVALTSGAFDSATVVFLVIAELYNIGADLSIIFYVMAGCCVLLHVRTFLLVPKGTVPYALPDGYSYGYKELPCCRCKSGGSETTLNAELPIVDQLKEENPDAKSLRACLRERYTWTNVIFFCFCQFRIIYFIGSFNLWIGSFSGDEVEVDNYTTVFGILQCFGVVIAPLSGAVIDVCRRKFSEQLPNDIASLKAVAVAFRLTNIIVVAMSVTSVIPNLELQYLTFALQVLARSCLYGLTAAFVSVIYPSQHFGVLYSLPVVVGGLTLLLQYPVAILVSRAFGNDFTAINCVLLALTVIAGVHPAVLFREVRTKCRLADENLQQKQTRL